LRFCVVKMSAAEIANRVSESKDGEETLIDRIRTQIFELESRANGLGETLLLGADLEEELKEAIQSELDAVLKKLEEHRRALVTALNNGTPAELIVREFDRLCTKVADARKMLQEVLVWHRDKTEKLEEANKAADELISSLFGLHEKAVDRANQFRKDHHLESLTEEIHHLV
jgi:hypothetical protein